MKGAFRRPRGLLPRSVPARRVVAGFLVGAIVILLFVGLVAVLQAREAYAHLQAAIPKVSRLQEEAAAGDPGAAATARELCAHAGAAREAVHGPHWSVLGVLPILGDDVAAAQTVTEVIDDLAGGALVDLVDAVAAVDPANLAPVDGRIDVARIQAVAPHVVAAHDSLTSAQGRLADIDTVPLVGRLAARIEEFATQLNQLRALTATAARAVEVLPPMLGAEGERNYLLLAQNNAEPRATGGFAGSVLHIRAENGLIEVVEQRAAGSFARFAEPVLDLTPPELGLFGTLPARYFGNVTYTPDFPRSGELAAEMWRQDTGLVVDGVASVDPVALQYLLRATGPLTLPTGQQLTADNAARVLLNQVYLDIEDPQQQDAFFEVAAGAVFDKVLGGAAEPAATIAALDRSADEGRLMLWSAHAEEQERLVGTTLSGELRGHVDDSPVVSIYLNDNTPGKLGYYQRVTASVEVPTCHEDGSQELSVSVRISSRVPEPAEELSSHMTGGGQHAPVGVVRSTIYLYAPTGGTVTDVRVSDGDASVSPHVHDGLFVVAKQLELEPGESVTFEYDVTTGEGLGGEPLVRLTPGPTPDAFTASTSQCGS
ncbi:DUF4012 domain-containing protein [Georgenia sp. 10Sc9-8]|uniref:DUF4012 domain-containing protein n=1 Tax=Georgenia halotolerans TaxID=3028317 RepID=A0ABT5TZB3_9MICO|nr:DUF4012 domain-containing protein [Georgenia halotolerans]